MNTFRRIALVAFILTATLVTSVGFAQDYVVLDAMGGLTGKFMQPEVQRLERMGHHVTYRPWWRWRSAVRQNPGPVNLVGFSMGGGRAVLAARRMDVIQMDLIDPYRFRNQPLAIPQQIPTTVFRATRPSFIQSNQVLGTRHEVYYDARHIQMGQMYRTR